MIAVTQNQRDKLIYKLMGLIESYKETASGTDEQVIYEIALSSLTAEVFGYVGEDAIEAGEELFSTTLYAGTEDLLDYSGDKKPAPLYLSPPVSEINLPPEFNESHDSFNEFRRGWNGAISEFKRLNGLEE